jgi:hypothetical protein
MEGGVGTKVDAAADPGSSMRGVTGREPVQSGGAGVGACPILRAPCVARPATRCTHRTSQPSRTRHRGRRCRPRCEDNPTPSGSCPPSLRCAEVLPYLRTTGELKEGFGDMPVDSENKACALRPWTFSFPHMVSFHCSWLGFFVTFVSTFAAAPMVRAPPSFKPTSSNTNGFAPPQMTPATPIGLTCKWFLPPQQTQDWFLKCLLSVLSPLAPCGVNLLHHRAASKLG